MSNIYLEFSDEVVAKHNMPGPIQTMHLDYLGVGHKSHLANRVWFETDEGYVYRLDSSGNRATPLIQTELDDFFWIKLRAINV